MVCLLVTVLCSRPAFDRCSSSWQVHRFLRQARAQAVGRQAACRLAARAQECVDAQRPPQACHPREGTHRRHAPPPRTTATHNRHAHRARTPCIRSRPNTAHTHTSRTSNIHHAQAPHTARLPPHCRTASCRRHVVKPCRCARAVVPVPLCSRRCAPALPIAERGGCCAPRVCADRCVVAAR
jgi:hypothetical protein